MNFKPIFIISLLCFWSNALIAQIEKKVYQTLPISDSTKQINFNFLDSFEVVIWKQDSKMMFETCIRMEINSEEVLDNLVKEGRYKIIAENLSQVKMMKFAAERPVIKSTKGKVFKETVVVRIYLPESYVVKDAIAFRTDTEVLMARKQ